MQFQKGMKPNTYVAYHRGCTLKMWKDSHGRWNAEQVYAGSHVASAVSANLKESREKYIERMFARGVFSNEKAQPFK